MLCVGWIGLRVACVRREMHPSGQAFFEFKLVSLHKENENELTSELVHFRDPKPQTREKQGGPVWEGTVNRGDACLPLGRRARRLERHGKP